MNRMHQIHVGLLISLIVAACSATEKRPFYEVLHETEFLFDVEDYHADMVLGMLPYIKTSIKDFRKRNFTRHDIENMYQTLTIFWPVVRKYLHLKEELVEDNSSEDTEKYKHNTSSSSSPSFLENNKILIKENIEFDNAEARSKVDQSQISQSIPFVYKRDQPISANIEINSSNKRENQGTISDTTASISTSPRNKETNNRRKYVARFKSIRDSLPKSGDDQTEMTTPETSTLIHSKDKQNKLKVVKGIRETSPINNDKISIQNNIQPARARSPSRNPFRIIGSDHISTTDETEHTTATTTPFSYTTRRPYKRIFKPISKNSLSPDLERLIQVTGTIATKNSANEKFISNNNFEVNSRRPSRKTSILASQDVISTTEEITTSTPISTQTPTPTKIRPSRRPSKPLSLGTISTQEERPSTSFYHNLLRNSSLRLLQTATQASKTNNRAKSTKTVDRSIFINAAGRSISTPSTPGLDQTTNPTGTKPTRTADRSISTTSIPVLSSASSGGEPYNVRILSPQATINGNSRNSATSRDKATTSSPVQNLRKPINENTFFFSDLSSIMQALGHPIDVTNLTG